MDHPQVQHHQFNDQSAHRSADGPLKCINRPQNIKTVKDNE